MSPMMYWQSSWITTCNILFFRRCPVNSGLYWMMQRILSDLNRATLWPAVRRCVTTELSMWWTEPMHRPHSVPYWLRHWWTIIWKSWTGPSTVWNSNPIYCRWWAIMISWYWLTMLWHVMWIRCHIVVQTHGGWSSIIMKTRIRWMHVPTVMIRMWADWKAVKRSTCSY